jgi:hypothetical protein
MATSRGLRVGFAGGLGSGFYEDAVESSGRSSLLGGAGE